MEVPKIIVEPPGKKAKKVVEEDAKYIATSTKTSPVVAARAKNAIVEDVDGNIYIDFSSGIGVLNIGHCHPAVVEAVKSQAEKLFHFAGTDFYYEIQVELAKKLCSITPGKFAKKVFYTNSGAESNEAALKLARWSTQRKQFFAFINAFHGRTMGALALTASKPVHRDRYFPMMPGVNHIPYAYCYRCRYKLEYPSCDIWCAKILDEVYLDTYIPPDEVAGIFVEPVQGEGGYVVPPGEFMRELKKIAEKHDFLFIDDEVQAGFGRTGKMFGIEHFGVVPDIVSMAKAMGAGIPIGAIVFNAKYDWGVEGSHSNTYGGNLIACAAALANIQVIEKERLAERADKLGKIMNKRLKEMMEKYELIGDVRGLGLMQATEFVKNRKTKEYAKKERDKIVELGYKRGLILLPCGKSGIRYIPPLTIEEEYLEKGLEVLESCIKDVSK
ncbi:MAG: acetyl ornithine aminotransferase family protein [Thermoplasmata archaeon]